MAKTHNGEQCEICEAGSQYAWRIKELEDKVSALYNLLIATTISSISTLVGIIVIYITK